MLLGWAAARDSQVQAGVERNARPANGSSNLRKMLRFEYRITESTGTDATNQENPSAKPMRPRRIET